MSAYIRQESMRELKCHLFQHRILLNNAPRTRTSVQMEINDI